MCQHPSNKKLSNQHPNLDRFWSQLGSILGRFGELSWGQVGPKTVQKSIQKTIKNIITFWIALDTDFDEFWAPTWPQKSDPFLSQPGPPPKSSQDITQEPPRPLQETPQDPSKRPLGTDFGATLDSSLMVFGPIFLCVRVTYAMREEPHKTSMYMKQHGAAAS